MAEALVGGEADATNYRYRIEGSTDNATWTTLADRTGTTSTSQVQTVVLGAQARYIRVTVTGLPSGVWASIRNLEIYDRPFTAILGTFRLVNRKSGKVMDVSDASSADGAAIIQWPSTGGTNQQWKLLPNADGSFRLVNVRSGKLLESPDSSTQGAALDQSTDDGGDNQWWKPVPSQAGGYYRLVNVRNGWCADVKDALHHGRCQGHPVAHHRRVEPGLAAHRPVTVFRQGARATAARAPRLGSLRAPRCVLES